MMSSNNNAVVTFLSIKLEDVLQPEVRANRKEHVQRKLQKYICMDRDPDQKPLLWWK